MTQRAVHIEQIDVHRVMGIARGKGYSLSELDADIILVHGTNGVGKSTTARAIQELLWPGRTELERPTLGGRFSDGLDKWQLEIEAGHSEVLCNGQAGSIPEFGPPENRRRYYLSLHDLILDENEDFAKIIADKSQGGFDLDAAAKNLDFRDRGRSRSKEQKSVQELQAKVKDARHHQNEIEREFAQLEQLQEQHAKASLAGTKIEKFKQAREFHEAKEKCNHLKVKLTAIPDGVARLQGDERQKLDDYAKRIKDFETQLNSEMTRCTQAESTLLEVALGDEGVDPNVLLQLKGWQQQLKEVEAGIRQDSTRLAEAESSSAAALQRLSKKISREQLNAIDVIEVKDLSQFARKAHRLLGKKHALSEQKNQLSADDSPNEQAPSSQQLHDGIMSLSKWLASPEPTDGPTVTSAWKRFVPTAVVAVAIVVMTMLLVVTTHWAWSFAILLALGVIGAGWWIGREIPGRQINKAREVHQQSYDALGIESPQSWDNTSISQHFNTLVTSFVNRAKHDDRNARFKELKQSLKAFKQEADKIKQERDHLSLQLGLNIDFLDDEWLPLLVDNISQWQKDKDLLVSIRISVEDMNSQRSQLLKQINDSLQSFSYSKNDSAATAAQAITDLESRTSRHRKAIETRRDSKQRIKQTISPALEALATQQTDLFSSMGITDDQQPIIDDWLTQRPTYLELKKRLSNEEAIRDNIESTLTGHPEVMELDLPTIEQGLEELQAVSNSRDALMASIAGIEQQVIAAKKGHGLSTALEDCGTAVAELEKARDENCHSSVGSMLTEFVREKAIEHSRPEVFRRANELLVKFTRGTLQLELDDRQSSPSFHARSATGKSRPLNQLSSGERIQLLMAVRLAFLESDERSRLPLLFDEALGTTDDGRIAVIIDSVIELAREGRQIFYFTAQQDEVGKWIARLEQAGVSHKVIDLEKIRQLASSQSRPLEIATIKTIAPPSLDGLSYEEVGRTLNVPGLDPLEERVDSIHLWHVLDDAQTLSKLLEMQIYNWGQLQLMVDHGGAELIDLNGNKLARAAAIAKAIEAACSAWRVGRGKAVDRTALVDSEFVSDSFIDDISDLANATGGEARAIIAALREGQIKRWRTSNTENLNEYFESNGYLTDQTPLAQSEVRVRVLGAAANDLKNNLISDSLITRIVGSLPR